MDQQGGCGNGAGAGAGGCAARGPALSAAACYRYLFLLATLGGAALLLLSSSDLLFVARDPFVHPWQRPSHPFTPDHSFTIENEGCTITYLKPLDASINKFVKTPKVPRCPESNFTFVRNNDTHIWIQKEDIPPDFNLTSCCYASFGRSNSVNDITSKFIDDRIEYKPCKNFSDYIEVKDEFVKVTCDTYVQYLIFAPWKRIMKHPLVREAVRPKSSGYNVLVLGLDAVSRLNFHRTMPKTVAFLKNKGAVELLGYNKVADNTFPNLTPLLLGIKEGELRKYCWPNVLSTFDNCPFLWEWFKDTGYYTALFEDTSSLATFNFGKTGFIGTPTDYYAHTFIHEAEHNWGNIKDFNSYLCMGSTYFYQVLLDYVVKLSRTLKHSKLFGFFWEVTMSHDYLNYPMIMDNSYEEFLKTLDSSRYLQNTIIIFISDHGIRWGDIRLTKQGRLEERLPLAFILVPPTFRDKYNKAFDNLKINSRRLTTPFDIHATLLDLANMDTLTNESITRRSQAPYAHERSVSLFLPIPGNRTCKVADIDEHWCTCHRGQKKPTDGEEAGEAGAHLVEYLNFLTRHHPQCARLRLAAVVEATELVVDALKGMRRAGSGGGWWREYLVVVRAEPGGGVFEATLRRHANTWQVAGAVSRLNLYGDQSRCMYNYQLKLYCFCTGLATGGPLPLTY